MHSNQAGPPPMAVYWQERRTETRMPAQTIAELSAVASNSSADLSKRIAAVDELGSSGDQSAFPVLKVLLGRNIAPSPSINWDPVAAQRVVELHAIAALHRLGNDSELGRIAGLVAAAGQVLQGPYDERRNATATIATMGSIPVIRDLIALLQNGSSTARANVIESSIPYICPKRLSGRTLATSRAPKRRSRASRIASRSTETGDFGGSWLGPNFAGSRAVSRVGRESHWQERARRRRSGLDATAFLSFD